METCASVNMNQLDESHILLSKRSQEQTNQKLYYSSCKNSSKTGKTQLLHLGMPARMGKYKAIKRSYHHRSQENDCLWMGDLTRRVLGVPDTFF